MSVTINSFEIENTKRVEAVSLDCTGSALTVIGGRNGAGKTSVLDAIAYALGGEKFRPSQIQRTGAEALPEIKVTMSNGLVVTRKGKNSALMVTDPQGMRGGQALLNAFVEQLALDLPKFLALPAAGKAGALLKIVGVGDELAEIDEREKGLFDRRRDIGRDADRAAAHAESLPTCPGAVAVDVAGLLAKRQQIVREQDAHAAAVDDANRAEWQAKSALAELQEVAAKLAQLQKRLATLDAARVEAEKAVPVAPTSTDEIDQQLADAAKANAEARAEADRLAAVAAADELAASRFQLSHEIDVVRSARVALLDGADLPLPGLTVVEGELIYNGQAWDCMSGAEQLRVATAIVRKLNPECGFVLVDRLEQMDFETLREFGDWASSEGLQIIATRVSTGEECSIIIDDGVGVANDTNKQGDTE